MRGGEMGGVNGEECVELLVVVVKVMGGGRGKGESVRMGGKIWGRVGGDIEGKMRSVWGRGWRVEGLVKVMRNGEGGREFG